MLVKDWFNLRVMLWWINSNNSNKSNGMQKEASQRGMLMLNANQSCESFPYQQYFRKTGINSCGAQPSLLFLLLFFLKHQTMQVFNKQSIAVTDHNAQIISVLQWKQPHLSPQGQEDGSCSHYTFFSLINYACNQYRAYDLCKTPFFKKHSSCCVLVSSMSLPILCFLFCFLQLLYSWFKIKVVLLMGQ